MKRRSNTLYRVGVKIRRMRKWSTALWELLLLHALEALGLQRNALGLRTTSTKYSHYEPVYGAQL